jgi:hypothetical protein
MMKNPVAMPHLREVAAIAKYEPGLYEVVDTYPAATKKKV